MAAASSATAAGAITAQTRISSENRRVSISVSFPTPHATKQRRKLVVVVRNSGEESARATEQEIEIPVVEAPPSLISALNVDKALRGLAITDVDHYGRLGLQSGCSYDQVSIAYNSKIAEVMNKGLDDEEELNKELELLKKGGCMIGVWPGAGVGSRRDLCGLMRLILLKPQSGTHLLRKQRTKAQLN
ncbi:hypothetical protein ACS0TY_021102 [Phlomoides rotata]